MNALYLVRHSGEELKNAQVLASISNGLEVSGKGPQGKIAEGLHGNRRSWNWRTRTRGKG